MKWRFVVNCLLGIALGLAIVAAEVNARQAEQIAALEQQLQRVASGGAR